MPHRHSADARMRRRKRAERRCYITSAPSGCRHIAVEMALVQRVKDMASSLRLHSEHNQISGRPAHFARQAALNAAASIGPLQANCAMAVHRRANRAKHDWSQSQASKKVQPQTSCIFPAQTPAYVPLAERPEDFLSVQRFSQALAAMLQTSQRDMPQTLHSGPLLPDILPSVAGAADHAKPALSFPFVSLTIPHN